MARECTPEENLASLQAVADFQAHELARARLEIETLRGRVTELQTDRSMAVEHYRAADLYVQVREFRAMAGLPIGVTCKLPSEERLRANLRLVTEEYVEVLEACGLPPENAKALRDSLGMVCDSQTSPALVDMPKLADGLGDLDFVNEGFRQEVGIPGKPVARAIAKANMSKRGGHVTAEGKFVKPPTWQPPDAEIEQVLRDHGWAGHDLDRELALLEGRG